MVTDPIFTGNLNYVKGKDAIKRFSDGSLRKQSWSQVLSDERTPGVYCSHNVRGVLTNTMDYFAWLRFKKSYSGTCYS